MNYIKAMFQTDLFVNDEQLLVNAGRDFDELVCVLCRISRVWHGDT